MQTALKRVLRGNGDGRASRRQRRRIRMSIPRHGLCISQGTGTWPITEKRVSLAWRILDIYLRIEKSLARWTMLSWIRATGQFLCLRVGDASVMNNLWWQFHSCFAGIRVFFMLNAYSMAGLICFLFVPDGFSFSLYCYIRKGIVKFLFSLQKRLKEGFVKNFSYL